MLLSQAPLWMPRKNSWKRGRRRGCGVMKDGRGRKNRE